MNKENKSSTWQMRAAKTDKVQIAKLAKRMKCAQSEAVRVAVNYLLAEKSQTALLMR